MFNLRTSSVLFSNWWSIHEYMRGYGVDAHEHGKILPNQVTPPLHARNDARFRLRKKLTAHTISRA
jgi:hypothetical protein